MALGSLSTCEFSLHRTLYQRIVVNASADIPIILPNEPERRAFAGFS